MEDFKPLLDYYQECFAMVDAVHFNSGNTQKQYNKWLRLDETYQIVLPITHSGIKDRREKKLFNSAVLRIGFIGSTSPYKGFPILKDVLAQMDLSKWRLDVWGGCVGKEDNLPIYYRGKFNESSVSRVYAEMDMLVVPSICPETFSLVALEALSYGVPVLVSENVGAKDIVNEYDPFFIYNDREELKNKMENLLVDRTALRCYNQAILQQPWNHDMLRHAEDVINNVY